MTKELKVSKIQQWLNDQQNMLDKGIVATPTEEYLDKFCKANHGSGDFLLMQLSKNYGYQLALDNLQNQL
tara:strand:+ start:428 stop:637 length:210 start_codon:yes stop_codon:yes gene_type:complete